MAGNRAGPCRSLLSPALLLFLLKFIFNWSMIALKFMLASAIQQCESATGMRISPPSWTSLPSLSWFLFLFFCFSVLAVLLGLWDFSSPPGIKPQAMAVKAETWTPRPTENSITWAIVGVVIQTQGWVLRTGLRPGPEQTDHCEWGGGYLATNVLIWWGLKFWERWEYQTTWPASWKICMQVTKQQLELDMEQQTGSK